MVTLTVRALLGLAGLAWACAAWAADPVAFVTDVRGDVTLEGGGRPRFLAELVPGARLVLAPQAGAAVMYIVTGEEFTLKGAGEFVVEGKGVRAVKGAAPASRVPPQRASAAVLVEASRAATASLRMRSAGPAKDAAGLLYPVDARVATLQPTLRWGGTAGGATTVVVTTTSGREVARGEVEGTTFRPSSRLEAGQAYVWEVSAGSRRLGNARFETLAAGAIQSADKARAQAKTFPDRVRLALVLQELGAAQDAREVWAQLAAERPDLPELANLAR